MTLDRRFFLQIAGAAFASRTFEPAAVASQQAPDRARTYPITLGKVVWVGAGQTADSVVREVQELGLHSCQIGFDNLSTSMVPELRKALDRYGVQATAISEHNPGKRIFNFYEGPLTVGIIPLDTRQARIQALKVAADVASEAGIPAIHTHLGFIPEDPNLAKYRSAVEAVREVAQHCKQRGVRLLCETGQETPITMVRLIEDVNTGNVFVNLDVANLILYGKGNPVDAMEVFGDRVRGIHAKDGRFPTNPHDLGQETAIGQGKVDFPAVFQKLKNVNYVGTMMIEREVGSDEERRRDILASMVFLQDLIARTYA
jgi:sugar phosphate isomerase/epimerase